MTAGVGADASGVPAGDPRALADLAAGLGARLLVGLDVDGTLAPIVERPEDARLEAGAHDALVALAAADGVDLAVVSGRPVADLRGQFAIPAGARLVGSHGAETWPGASHLDPREAALLAATTARLEEVASTLPGAWVERKPFAAALHVRRADPEPAAAALVPLEVACRADPALTVHVGHMVLEVAVRPTSKVTAVARLRDELRPDAVVFVGDDASDERVFAELGPRDLAVKAGPGATHASHRLATPRDVVAFAAALAERRGSARSAPR